MKIALFTALLCHALVAANDKRDPTSSQPASRVVTSNFSASRNGSPALHQSSNNTVSAVRPTTTPGMTHPQDSRMDSTPEMRQLQAQLASTKKELEVQTHLVAEKNSETLEADRQSLALRKQEDELRKQSEVAETFAKEKSQAAQKLQKELEAASVKAADSLSEKQETEKFVNQTEKEEVDLEKKLSAMKAMLQSQMRLTPISAKAQGDAKVRTTLGPAVSHSQASQQTTSAPAPQQPAAFPKVAEQHEGQAVSHSQASQQTMSPPAPQKPAVLLRVAAAGVQKQVADDDAVQKLIAENEKLKTENEKLKRQVSEKNTAEEKLRLRRRLKSKLVEADHRLHKR